MNTLNALAYSLRKDVLDMVYHAQAGHIGGDFSVMEILVALYHSQMNLSPQNADDPARDRLILSKGHSVEALYAVLASRGFFPKENLKTIGRFGSPYIGHPNNNIPGIEMNTGSLGHGLSVGVGMALAAKKQARPLRVYVVMGDGELAEGSVWEGAMSAAHFGLDNLCAVIDCNGLQISGSTQNVMNTAPLQEKWQAFGWQVENAQGNNVDALIECFEKLKATKGKPGLILAHTTKGCGVSFMENSPGWHHKIPDAQQYRQASQELASREEAAG